MSKRKVNHSFDVIVIGLVLAVGLLVVGIFSARDLWVGCETKYMKKGMTKEQASKKCSQDMRDIARNAHNVARFTRSGDPLDLID